MALESDSSSGHRDSHEAGTTSERRAGASECTTPETDAAIRAETVRLFASTRWFSPIGHVAAALVLVVSTDAMLSLAQRTQWMTAMIAVAAVMGLGPSVVPTASRNGIPHVLRLSHLFAGLLWGTTLWLDSAARADPQYRWVTLATLFAVTAGTSAGLAGLHQLSTVVQVPMWSLAAAALVVEGDLAPATGILVFMGIVLPHQRQTGNQFRELITLRLSSQQTAERTEWAATHDELTDLVNRSGLFRALANADAGSHALFIDLDHFKIVNDRFGHVAGDEVLVEVANRLRACFRPDDIVARLGGDEFVVVLGGAMDDHTIDRLARRAITLLEEPIVLGRSEDAYISASIGVARIADSSIDPERLLTEADHALYQAKRTGRRRVVRFDTTMEAALERRTGLETSLRKAIRDGSIQTYGQPIVNLQTGEVVGIECLSRWPLTDGALVPPSVFIPLAEETGLIDDLTTTLVDRAGQLLADWRDRPDRSGIQVGINISPIQLERGGLVEAVAETITTKGLEPGRLVIELTESAGLSDQVDLPIVLRNLHELGALIAIDDFGTGYSSLSSLLDYPISYVKLDRSLIAALNHDPRRRAIISTIHQLAEVVGQVVIAEGVETPDQVHQLRTLGVRSGQGFGLAVPVALDELDEYLASTDWAARVHPSSTADTEVLHLDG